MKVTIEQIARECVSLPGQIIMVYNDTRREHEYCLIILPVLHMFDELLPKVTSP
jgi:hypothetical protein